MYSLEVRELIVVGVDADAEEKPRISAVDDFIIAELHEVRLVFLITRGHEAVDLVCTAYVRKRRLTCPESRVIGTCFAFEFDFLLILEYIS